MIEGKSESLLSTFWYLQKKKKYGIKIVSIDRLLNKEQFYIKKGQAANVHQKLVRELILILINKPKQSLHTRNSFSNPFPFNCQDYEKELWPVSIKIRKQSLEKFLY